MISVLTLTYKRHHILEEAIQSFINQGRDDCEMVVINDAKDVSYTIDSSNITIYNVRERFPSVSRKLEWGFSKCNNEFIYRLDDDDLLYKDALSESIKAINSTPRCEIYRSKGNYFFVNNKYKGRESNVNNGNIYTKKYLDRINIEDWSVNEDVKITFGNNADICTFDYRTMIYRWGMGTYHISGMGTLNSEEVFTKTDRLVSESGEIHLQPKFLHDYYSRVVEVAND